ncbi:glycosyltransferase [Marinobacter sp. F3R08]|uniref:glycosyltransferase n=1 Tax=Marinobacter sp. F3R08 TaxID=2841559 RepID=UPI001C08D74E|nr:glycosyltransferase [Marinobacter sp. F3R08]MBU2954463.1 glycosyltransferase [Marinobacter sp. F3R08]
MRIVIDMQGAQTESRFRGIGRHTLSFAQAVARNRGDHDVILALNGLFPDTVESIRTAFDGLLPQENIRVWYAPGPVRECEPGNESRRRSAELVREAFLASLNADVIHIVSMFEGFVDDAVSSIGCFDSSTPVSVTIHDLIPLLNPDHYLTPNPPFQRFYKQKIEHLTRAELFLAISDSAKQEGMENLQRSGDCFVNVSSAIDPEFQKLDVDAAVASSVLGKFSIRQPFVLYTGGADERKNLPRLIEAFAKLPQQIQTEHQLVFAGKMSEANIAELRRCARECGLAPDNLCFTGYVTDHDLILLYNLCRLYVFPSWHEGFGLPALEAMACGAPVIGANTSSLPEVIALDAAMFDPFDVDSISEKMARALMDEAFRNELRTHGLGQAELFSWDITAQRALSAWGTLDKPRVEECCAPRPDGKPRLAFVSPMPPERTGIADYSAELLPALAEYYNIELVVAQKEVAPSRIGEQFQVRDVDWLRENAGQMDRVLYQMGNAPFHTHMLSLLEEVPGTVVMHDFYLSGLMSWLEIQAGHEHAWTRALYNAHGYSAVRERFRDVEAAKLKYPANFQVLQNAQGMIVHSDYSRRLMHQWYGRELVDSVDVIPLVRQPEQENNRQQARAKLGLGDGDFMICSFGFLDATKLNHRLLESWLQSAVSQSSNSKLVFVGQCPEDDYGKGLLKTIDASGCGDRIHITGFASAEQFRDYLLAADVAVQLRAHSRGETSAAVLDCMGHGLPVIVNANGSMAELDNEAVWLLDDEFADTDLTGALETLWGEPQKREALGQHARDIILSRHAPAECARQYAESLERFHGRAATGSESLIRAVASQKSEVPDSALIPLSECIAASLPLPKPARRLFLDLTATCRNDLKTGIERVARSVLMALLESCPEGYRVEPVYLSNTGGRWHYRYASHYVLGLLGCPTDALEDEIVEPESGDILLGLDLSGDVLVQAAQSGLFVDYRNRGVRVYFTVFDLLPVQMPDVFPAGARSGHTEWLRTVSQFDGAVCISRTVAGDLSEWQAEVGLAREQGRAFDVRWFHLGADVASSAPSRGVLPGAERTLGLLGARPTFLMVGTIEPRKGHLPVLDAFEQLWSQGVDVNLVIVGQEGWKGLADSERAGILKTLERLKAHPEDGKRLFWLPGISDEYLGKVYGASTCLIAASYGEGFGLPLIEAAQHKLPVMARDIPVFREVAGTAAWFYPSDRALPEAIKGWLAAYQEGAHPKPDDMPWLTWKESAAQLVDILIKSQAR